MAATASACLFTAPINMPPTIQIVPPLVISRGQPATFTATFADDQSQAPAISWARVDGGCPDATDRTQWPPSRTTTTMFTVDGPMTKVPFCVWAVATDTHGAATAANFAATPTNHAPTAAIDVVSPTQPPYSFLSQFVLSARTNDVDMDPLMVSWKLGAMPAGSKATLGVCADNPKDQFRCLASDLPGDYCVDLTAADASEQATASITLTVLADALPCIDSTMPDYLSGPLVHLLASDGASTADNSIDSFAVLRVADDLDSWPSNSSQLQFSWSTARNTDPLVFVGIGGATLPLLTLNFRVGDKVRVRVEIADRNNSKEIQDVLAGCNDQDVCDAPATRAYNIPPRAGCHLRVTWNVEYR
ncbi:MAG TPA: hypothetical protein VGL59_21835 [Polyangia bacterium]